MPLVSVIMPSYNHAKYLPEAIDSVLNQSFGNFELIIIDDASVDASKNVISTYKTKDQRIKAFFHEKNMGISYTMNEAISKARGKYIALISSDDMWHENKLESQINILSKNEEIVLWSDGWVIDSNGNFLDYFTKMHDSKNKKRSGNIFEDLLDGNYICGQSIIFKKDSLKNLKYDNHLKYLNDYKFMLDLAASNDFYFIPELLIYYRVHGENSILSDKKGWAKDRFLLGKELLNNYDKKLSNSSKNKIFLDLSMFYFYNKKFISCFKSWFNAIRLNPSNRYNFIYFFRFLINDNDLIINFLIKFRYFVWNR